MARANRGYFSDFPQIEYQGKIARTVMAKPKIAESLLSNPAAIYSYTVTNDLRPDQVAHLYYGDWELLWLIFLANNIVDPYYGWPLSQNTFGYLTILGSFKFMYILYHPIFVLSISGLIVLILNIEIPSIVMNSTKYLGNIVIPLSLILLGYSLSNLKIKNLTKGFIYSIARFLIGVLSALIVIYLFKISGPKAGVILIMSTMPVALLNYIFTVQIEKDTTTVAGLVVVSTFSTLISLPFLLNFLLIYFN